MLKQHSRNIVSILNAISAIGVTLVNGLLGIVTTKIIIEKYGSDFNGLNSTANQIVNVLLILEGGFTLASNVALFKPLIEKNYKRVNNLLFVTRQKFQKVGSLFLAIGLTISIIYTFIVNSSLDKELIFTVIFITIIPAAFNLYYATTYRVLLQAMQTEYIINIISMFTLGLGHIGNIVLILLNGSVWYVRFITTATALLNSFIIAGYVKKKCKYLNIVDDGGETINGTRDVMVQKITGMVYNSAPIIFLSILPAGGTVLASVYAVYNNVFNMIKSLLRSIIDAPRLSIGQLLIKYDNEVVWNIYAQYEYISFLTIFITVSTAYPLVIPFVSIYTNNISDINYSDYRIAIFMTAITFFELIHIPSGHLINMSGEFKISKIIQLIGCIVLIISMPILSYLFGIYGLLASILITSFLLALFEMGFVHTKFFKGKLSNMFRLLLPMTLAGFILCCVEKYFIIRVDSFISLIILAIWLLICNFALAMVLSIVFCKKEFSEVLLRVKLLIKNYKR